MMNNSFLKFSVLFSLLVITLSSCKKEQANIPTQISVLTYNIAGLPDIISQSTPSLYTPFISKLVNDYDVVHVQEDFDFHDSLLLYNNHPYRTETMGTTTIGDGLNTLSRYPIKNFKRIKWTDCADTDCYTPKGFSYSQIEISAGVTIDFYNAHANAQSDSLSLNARRKNTVQLYNYIQEHSTGNAIILMGDFNSRYTRLNDTIRMMLDLGLKDVWVELIRGGDVPVKDGNSVNNCETMPRTRPDCERVDKIFYRSNDKIEIVPMSYQLDDERFYYQGNDTIPLSDHWPMFADFLIKAK